MCFTLFICRELKIYADLLILRWFFKAINMFFCLYSLMKNDKIFSLIEESSSIVRSGNNKILCSKAHGGFLS